MPSVSKPFQPAGQRTWVVTVRPGDGQGYQVALGTRDERKAVLQAAALTIEVEAGRWKPPVRSETLDGLVDGYRAWYLGAAGENRRAARERSWNSDGFQLARVIGWLSAAPRVRKRAADVTRADALAFVDARRAEVGSIETVKRAVRVARAAWNWAIERGHAGPAGENPWRKIKFPKPPKTDPRNLSEFELRKVFEAVRKLRGKVSRTAAPTPGRLFTPALEGICAAALYAGLRNGEIAHLAQEDLRWADQEIRVRCDEEFSSKDRESRTTVFPLELRAILAPWRRDDAPTALVFPGRDGKPRSESAIDASVRHLKRVSGVDFTLHDLRRTFARICADRGIPANRIRDYLGHESIATTEGYYLGRNTGTGAGDADRLALGLADTSQCVAGGKPGGAVGSAS